VRPLEGGFGRWTSLGFPVEKQGLTQSPPSEDPAPPLDEAPPTDNPEVQASDQGPPFPVTTRYCPEQDLPTSSFLPGLGQPRPDERENSGGPWTAENWQEIQPWLFGVDLYNAGFFWEAHEAWEAVWKSWPKDSSEGLVVRGCIQAAAALLKIRLNCPGGVKKLSERSLNTWKLSQQGSPDESTLGFNLSTLQKQFEAYWMPLQQGRLPTLQDFPRIELVSKSTDDHSPTST
jgi:uncharacterized protein